MHPPSDSRRIVLVVDDDEVAREAVSMLLELSGYRVVQAENGAVALDILREGLRPGLIILDLMMPVKDGWQFLEEQRNDPSLAGLKTVVLSAIEDLHELPGVVASFTKPAPLERLLDLAAKQC